MFGRFTKAWQENVAPHLLRQWRRHELLRRQSAPPGRNRHHAHAVADLGRSIFWSAPAAGVKIRNSPSQGPERYRARLLPVDSLASSRPRPTPAFTFQNYTSLNNRRFLNVPRETHNLQANITKEQGSHSLKFGWITELARLNNTDFNTPTFDFTRGLTSGPVAAATSSDDRATRIASLLLGIGDSGSAPIGAATAVTAMYHGAYFQDSWRVNRRLTAAPRDALGAADRHVPNATTGRTISISRSQIPLSQQTGLPLKGGLVFATPDNRGAWQTDKLNLAPRFGMAYKITRQARASAAVTASSIRRRAAAPRDGFSTTTTWVSTVGGDGIKPNPGRAFAQSHSRRAFRSPSALAAAC